MNKKNRLEEHEMKYCPYCKTNKPASSFYISDWRGDGRGSYCTECVGQIYQHQKHDIKFRRIESVFGISREEYNRILDAQNGACAICLKPEDSIRFKFLAVDHDHITGKIRGLLCHRCNKALGQFADDTGALLRAVEYLVKHRT